MILPANVRLPKELDADANGSVTADGDVQGDVGAAWVFEGHAAVLVLSNQLVPHGFFCKRQVSACSHVPDMYELLEVLMVFFVVHRVPWV